VTRVSRARHPASTFVARLVVAFVLALASSRAEAAQGATVAILSSGSTAALAEASSRLRGELSALRFHVLLLSRPTSAELGEADRREWLESMAESQDLDAAIEVVGDHTPLAADVWIFQRSPRRVQRARVVLEPNTADRAGTLAIRAIEVLRSYNLEADLAAKVRARDEQEPVVDAREKPTSQPAAAAPAGDDDEQPWQDERVGIELGAGLLAGLGGVDPAVLPVLRLSFRAHPSLVVHATASGFGTRPTLRAAAGSVRVARSYGALGLCFCPASSQRLAPYLALGAGAMRTSLDGAAEAPASGHSVTQWSLLLDAGAGGRLRLPGRYYATLSGHVQLTQPRVAIHVVDEELASSGRPNLVANLTIGTWL
jgi:hypothetical protein